MVASRVRSEPVRGALQQDTTSKPVLRACDFFVFTRNSVLKTNDLCANKSRRFKKVTNSERSEGPAVVLRPTTSLFRFQPSRLIVLPFKRIQCRLVPQRQPDIVQPFQQTKLAERINFELSLESITVCHGLIFKRDGQLVIRQRLRVVQQLRYLGLSQSRQHNAVLAGIREKNVGKCRRNHSAKPKVRQRPCGVLTARSAGEVLSCDEGLRALVAR